MFFSRRQEHKDKDNGSMVEAAVRIIEKKEAAALSFSGRKREWGKGPLLFFCGMVLGAAIAIFCVFVL